jgi:nanoRNase/pAp phosphatase (c-di-AMP/oligoRNAs hydrolase)
MKRLTLDELVSLIERLKNERVILTFHSIGDTDSISSAVALAQYLQNSKVITPDDITSNAARILKSTGFVPEEMKRSFDHDATVAIMLDTNNFNDCGAFDVPLSSFKGQLIVIDHHAKPEVTGENAQIMDDESYNSTASIVYEVLKRVGFLVDKNTALLLLTGIISDSADLKNADYRTFIQVGELLKIAGIDYNGVLNIMQHLADPYARAKTIEDLAGAKLEIVEGVLFAHGSAHSHANIAADLMIKAGADVALFSSAHENEVSFSARLRPLFDKKLGIHVGVILKRLAPIINGTGGGHPCAGGAYGKFVDGRSEFESAFREEILKSIKNTKKD